MTQIMTSPKFTKRARNIIKTDARFTELIACPGSGKTTVAVARVQHLLQDDPDARILVLSFTNATVLNFQQRLVAHGVEGGSRLTVSTCHTFAHQLALRHPQATAMTAKQQKKKAAKRKAEHLNTATSNSSKSAFDAMLAAGTAVAHQLKTKTLRLHHLIVDEYQDCTPAQHRLIAELARKARTTLVVADPMQAVYGFGGSRYRSLEKVLRKAGALGEDGVQVHRLDWSRRLTPQIAALASAISQPLGGQTIESAKDEDEGRVSKLLVGPDMNTLGRDIAGRIKRLLSKGIEPHQIALLGRVKAVLHTVAQHLRALGIPALLAGTNDHLGDVLNVLWLADRVEQMHDTGAGLAFGDGASKRKGGGVRLSKAFQRELRDELGADQETYLGPADDDADGETADASMVEARWTKFVAEVAKMRRGSDLESRYRTCALAYLRLHGGGRANKSLRDQLNTWIPKCRDFVTATEMAQHLRTVAGRKAIHCSSIHGAKGMEWDYVFVVGVTESVLPDRRAKTKQQRAEERRILYVGITRAAHRLRLCHAPIKVAKVRHEYRQLSRFVMALPSNVLKKIKVQ